MYMQIDYSVPGCTFVFGYLFLHEQKQTCEINKMAAEKYNTKSVIINILSISITAIIILAVKNLLHILPEMSS